MPKGKTGRAIQAPEPRGAKVTQKGDKLVKIKMKEPGKRRG